MVEVGSVNNACSRHKSPHRLGKAGSDQPRRSALNSPAVASEEEWLHRVVPTSQTGTGHGGMLAPCAVGVRCKRSSFKFRVDTQAATRGGCKPPAYGFEGSSPSPPTIDVAATVLRSNQRGIKQRCRSGNQSAARGEWLSRRAATPRKIGGIEPPPRAFGAQGDPHDSRVWQMRCKFLFQRGGRLRSSHP